MPRSSEPFSVPDGLDDAWREMVRRNTLLQTTNDPLFGFGDQDSLRGGAGEDRLASAPAKASTPPAGPPAQIDPSRTNVFPRGADGKLHPIPGWHTTGPGDVGAWVHNVNWPGVAGDLGDIAAGVTSWLFPGAIGPYEKAAIAGGLWNAGRQTNHELDDVDASRR